MLLRIFAGRAGAELQRLDAEEKLRRSEAQLAEAQRIAGFGHFTWDIVADEVKVSEEVYRILGTTPEDYNSKFKDVISRIHPEDRQHFELSVNAALYEGQPYNVDFRVIRPNGDIRFVHEDAEVTYDEQARPILMLGTIQDITERKKAEDTLVDRVAQLAIRGLFAHTRQIVKRRQTGLDGDPRLKDLTPREREVLDLIGQGLSTANIANRLHRSQKTVKSHRLALGRKLGVSNRVELARIAIEAGLAPLDNLPGMSKQATNRQLPDAIAQREQAQAALRAIDAGISMATGGT